MKDTGGSCKGMMSVLSGFESQVESGRSKAQLIGVMLEILVLEPYEV